MTSCRDYLKIISDNLNLGVKQKNVDGAQINPSTEESASKNFPPLYFSSKITNASTSNVRIDKDITITHVHLINLTSVEIVFALGLDTGTSGKDITLPENSSISLAHDGIPFISYKGAEASGSFVYIIQGKAEE